MRRAVKAGIAVSVLALAGAVAYPLYQIYPKVPDRPFARPSGPFPVGTREYDWTDSGRAEPYTTDSHDRRRLVVQLWYPAAGAGDTARYLMRRREFASTLGGWAGRNARTNAVLDAPVAAVDSGFPVLLYSHGAGWTRWSATFATEWLASHGYVVVSVEHFGLNQTVEYPDGTPFSPDTLAFPEETGDDAKDDAATAAYLNDVVFPVWKADARFVLDRLEALNREPGPFRGRLDLSRVGALGWSMGGALAVQLTRDDPRIDAVVNHDGQLFDDVRVHGTAKPVMLIHHGVDDALLAPEEDRPRIREMMSRVAHEDSTARAASTADWYLVTIRGTDHRNFSDLVLFNRQPEGRLDPRTGHAIINAYTLAFFESYLRGRPSSLLDDTTSQFPEATLRAWRRSARQSSTAASVQ